MHDALLSAMFNLLHSIMIQAHLQSKYVATMKNMDDFHYEGKPPCATAKTTPLTVRKDELEGTGKSMKNALYVLWYAKRHVSG